MLSGLKHPPDLEERARRRVGMHLRGDKYRLDQLLGFGAMGAVYAATHRNGSSVALKLLHPEHARDADIKRRFLREGYLANKVKHPGVVRVLDDDVDDEGTAFLVMDLLEGRTLESEWQASGRTLAVPRVGQVGLALLDVLAAVHAEGIVHRDIKPENVFITTRGELMLLDLGIARLVLDSRSMTASGTMLGTPEFVAPEQAGGNVREVDGRTDLYSVGAMMFTLLTGHYVHEARTPIQTMLLAATRPARSIFDVWPEAPGGLANVVDVALSFDKTRRWPSALDMRTALARSVASFTGAGSLAPTHPAPPPPPPPRQGTTGTVVLPEQEPKKR